ncbi:hypothetical protein FB567DRAFT_588799 [Paraphoma chrysanthemicola]|uniref:DUF7730 domain-containing protein n=1 Tax=Paraphoma chrysanthemicola TaxID=798071 RepID=A0A8K0W3J0_9PLEO|nr:hypothetical protein FB567DRAFT_588799 [Paraphoma chrysanthemicola]
MTTDLNTVDSGMFKDTTREPVDILRTSMGINKPEPNKSTFHMEKMEAFAVNSKEAIQMYLPFKIIYDEMQYARSFPKQTIPFLEMPVEIRVQIYRLALKLDSPLEFWAESDTYVHTFRLGAGDKTRLLDLIGRRELNLSLLRTCRQVQTEAAEVFYGENEFRFTGLNGHMVANLFVRKIHKHHFQFIKHLTMSIPLNYDEYTDPTSVGKRDEFRVNILSNSWIDKEYEYVEAWEHLIWNLRRMERLSKLTLLVHHCTDFHGEISKVFSETMKELMLAKPELELQLVRLAHVNDIIAHMTYDEFEEYERNGLDDEGWWKAVGLDINKASEIRNLKNLAKKCTIKAAYTERRGKWVTIEGLPEEVLLPAGKEATKEYDGEGV